MPCSCPVSTGNRLARKCISVSRTSSTRGATVLRCSTDSERQSTRPPGSQPFSDLVHIVDCPGGQRDHQVKPGLLTGLHPLAIEAKEHLAGGPHQPLVAGGV